MPGGLSLPARLLALLLSTCVAACGSETPPDPSSGTRALRVAIPEDEGSLQPYTYITGYPGWSMMTLVYDTLFVLDEHNQPQPAVALNHEVSADGRRHTLTLRRDVRWHDGRPLTSDDVKFTFEYYQRHPHGRWTAAVRPFARIDAPDPHTLVLETTDPYPNLPFRVLADVPLIPRHVWQDVTDPRSPPASVGSGPFRLIDYQRDRVYRFAANRDYFAGAPAIDELIMPVVTDPATVFAAIESGELHGTTLELPPELLPRFGNRSDVTVVTGAGFGTTLLQFNHDRRPWDDARVRRAVALAIDTPRLVATVLLGQGTPGRAGWRHPSLAGLDAPAPEYDVAEARALLDAAGLHDRDGDGIRELDGHPLRPELLVQSNQPARVRAAELMAAAIRDIGIAARVRAEDATSLAARVWPDFDVSRGRSFDWAIFGWAAPMMADSLRMTALIDSDPRHGANNIGGFRSAEADRLSAALRTSADAETRDAALHALDALVGRERPFVMLWYADLAFAYRPAAYDGWRFQHGHGIFHKGSFLRDRDN